MLQWASGDKTTLGGVLAPQSCGIVRAKQSPASAAQLEQKEYSMPRKRWIIVALILSILALTLPGGCWISGDRPKADLVGPVSQAWVALHEGVYRGGSRASAEAITLDGSGNIYTAGWSKWGDDATLDYTTIKYDSDGNELWVAHYDGPAHGSDKAYAIALDGSGNVYVTGVSYAGGSPRGDDWDCDYATAKYDSEGNELWVARYDGPAGSYDYPEAIALDGSGNVYVTGYAILSGDYNVSDYGYATIKYTNDGTEVWVALYGEATSDSDKAAAIAVDDAGDVYVTGNSTSDYVTLKYDSSGHEVWLARYDGPTRGADSATAIALDGAGNVYVTGGSKGINGSDYATVKYDNTGKQLWVTRYDGPEGFDDYASDVAIDGNGNTYVTGGSCVARHYEYLREPQFEVQYATMKYDSNGNEVWASRYGSPTLGEDSDQRSDSGIEAVAVDRYGNVYVTGGRFDTVKYDSGGTQVWTASYTGSRGSGDRAHALAIDDTGNVYVAGSVNSRVSRPFACDCNAARDYEACTTIKYTPA